MQEVSTRTRRHLLIACLILGLIVLFWGLGSLQLMSLNEGRRALVIKEMFESKNWLLPTLNHELYLTKPPLLYWFSIGFSLIVGHVNEWTLRLPSALSALIVLLLTYGYTKKHFGEMAAYYAISLLIANVGFAMLARRAEIEMLLTALCFSSLLAALQYIEETTKKYWIHLSYALLGLAVLTKGPVALLFVTLPLLLAAFWTKNNHIKAILINKTGWLIFLVIGLSWYVFVTMKLGPDIWQTIAKRDMLDKMQSDEKAKPLLSYVAWVAVDFLLLIGLFAYHPRRLWAEHKHQLAFLIPAITSILVLVIFSLFANKHAKYLLPIYPAIAIVLGVHLAGMLNGSHPKMQRLILLIAFMLPLGFATYYVAGEARLYNYRISAFSEFQKWSASIEVDKLYALDNVDARLIYYSDKPIKVISSQDLAKLRSSSQQILVLSQRPLSQSIVDCRIKNFEPYLKKNKSLIVSGLGSSCNDLN